ncbi:MAG: hypothetical protein QM728_01155 [Gordonia sp. (in: high G+C Gram-positive bacteria)]|uniref:hypothetical protein n=1 Tax=Gordonia sp. (in: high G+C Gram-positive bacteria) TaxID=84139 RepID=UPI0039E5E94E
MSSSTRFKLASVIAGVGALSVLGAGAATAEKPVPNSAKVPGTSCTVGQVGKALAKADPESWNSLKSHPQRMEHWRQTVVLTPQGRKAREAKWARQHPNEAGVVNFFKANGLLLEIDPLAGTSDNPQRRAYVKARVKRTCGKF